MRSARRHILLCVIASTLQGGCASDRPADPPSTVRDSAGIRLVESTSPAWGQNPRPRILPTPDVTIGALEGSEGERLFQVAAAARLDDGRIVVANSGTHEIRYFDPAGKHLFSIGRRGEGPGEFRQITNLLRYPGGTLMVYDAILRRGTLLDPDGRVTRLVDFARSGPARPFGPVGRLTDGSIVVLFGSTRSYSGASGVVRDTLELGRFADDGTFLGIVGRVPGGEAFVVAGVGPFRLPLGIRVPRSLSATRSF